MGGASVLAMIQRFLITGGAGFIGSALVRHIIAETNCSVLVLDNLTYAASLEALAGVAGDPRYAFVQADINDGSKVSEILADYDPHAVIHLAAETHVDRSIDDPSAFIQTNVVGTFTLLQAVYKYWRRLPARQQESFRFHHVSTDEVYGSLGADGHFDETTPYAPRSPYSASKAASDHLVDAWYHTYGLPTLISNTSNNYGPWQFPEKLIPLTIINALEGKPLPVYGVGQNVRDWIHVDDHARALVAIATRGRVGERYCVGAGCERTNIDVVKTLCAIMDDLVPGRGRHESLMTFVADRPGHDLRYAIDAGKIAAELDWQPRASFEGGLRDTVAWYLNNRAWWEAIRKAKYRGDRLGIVA